MRTITQAAAIPSGLEGKVGPKGFIHNWIFVGVPVLGQAVHHAHLGAGTITHVTGHSVHVQFAGGHHREFAVEHDPGKVHRLESMSDEDIYQKLMGAGEGHRYDLALNELDRRDRAASEGKIRDLYAQRPHTDEDRDRVFRALTDLGENPEHAWAHAYGELSAGQAKRGSAIAQLREQGYEGRGFQDLARNAWKDDVRRRQIDAENATNGYLTNALGKRKGVNGWDLFTGPEATARKYASDELRQHWDQVGRPTFEDFRTGLLEGTARKRVTEDWLQ